MRREFDVLIGINLLREGLDLPEVSLVAILDADKEGYLRSATSLIQTAGRAAGERQAASGRRQEVSTGFQRFKGWTFANMRLTRQAGCL